VERCVCGALLCGVWWCGRCVVVWNDAPMVRCRVVCGQCGVVWNGVHVVRYRVHAVCAVWLCSAVCVNAVCAVCAMCAVWCCVVRCCVVTVCMLCHVDGSIVQCGVVWLRRGRIWCSRRGVLLFGWTYVWNDVHVVQCRVDAVCAVLCGAVLCGVCMLCHVDGAASSSVVSCGCGVGRIWCSRRDVLLSGWIDVA
jgi:hypothetical protein